MTAHLLTPADLLGAEPAETHEPALTSGADLAAAAAEQVALAESGGQSSDPLRPIVAVGAPLHELATTVETVLIEQEAPLYANGPRLVTPIMQEVEAAKGRTTQVAQLKEVTMHVLLDHMSRVASWAKVGNRGAEPVDPPIQAAQILQSRFGEWRFRRVSGVLTTPTLRPDGSLLNEPGYDAATRLFLMNPPALPNMPEAPTRWDAEFAIKLFRDLLHEFPFVDEVSKSVALSGILTPVVRGLFSTAPMHVTNAATPGTGKSYLMDTITAVASGQACPVMNYGNTEEEAEKRLGALLMLGQPIVSIDNMNGMINGASLCQYIERPTVQVRRLGASEMITIDNRATMFANGNNVSISQDLIRRSILCNLDAKVERPELREFASRPVDTILANRKLYITAALIIVRAYLLAGQPGKLPPLASFEGWSDSVRSALVWLGCADPVTSMEGMHSNDPKRIQRQKLIGAWAECIGIDTSLSTAELVTKARDQTSTAPWRLMFPQLNEAMSEIVNDHPDKWKLKFGQWLGRNKDIPSDELKITSKMDAHKKTQVWKLEKIET